MTTDDIAVPGGVPPGYGEALYWKLTTSRSRVLLVNLLALVSLVPWGALFFWVAVSAGWLPASIDFGAWQLLLALILATVVVLVLHELLHGATMALFGARPQYGVILNRGMFYATAPGFAFPRNRYLIVALTPLVVLSLLAILLMALLAGSPWVSVVILAATLNASGAAGDLWISAVVLRYPSSAYIIDEKDGMRVFLPGLGDRSA